MHTMRRRMWKHRLSAIIKHFCKPKFTGVEILMHHVCVYVWQLCNQNTFASVYKFARARVKAVAVAAICAFALGNVQNGGWKHFDLMENSGDHDPAFLEMWIWLKNLCFFISCYSIDLVYHFSLNLHIKLPILWMNECR